MKRTFFILVGIISAAFAIYFFACSSLDLFKLKVPRSGSKVSTVSHVSYYVPTAKEASN